jgi:hypothetical protein
MKPEIVALCEYASDHNGHLTIVDAFDAIKAEKFPWRAYFSVAAKIDMSGAKTEYQTVRLSIVCPENEGEEAIFETSSHLPHINDKGKINLVASFKGLIFKQAGIYRFQIYFDNDMVVNHSFKVERNGKY